MKALQELLTEVQLAAIARYVTDKHDAAIAHANIEATHKTFPSRTSDGMSKALHSGRIRYLNKNRCKMVGF